MTTARAEAPTSLRTRHIGTVLTTVVELSRSLTNRRSTPFGSAVLTRTQLDVLFVLAHAREPVTPGHLAATLNVTPGAITQTVEHLRDQNLVEQWVSDRDARVRVLGLTASAGAQVAAFEATVVERIAPWFSALDDD